MSQQVDASEFLNYIHSFYRPDVEVARTEDLCKCTQRQNETENDKKWRKSKLSEKISDYTVNSREIIQNFVWLCKA